MKNKKIFLLLMSLSLLAVPSAQAANQTNPVDQLDACPSLAGVTTVPVKHVGKVEGVHIFLDKNGNRVVPCRGENGLHFFIVSNFPGGQQLYEASRAQEMNRDFYDRSINTDTEHSVISFGNDHIKVVDMYDFQKQYQEKQITGGKNLSTIPSSLSEDMTKFLTINPSWLDSLPEKYKTLTPGEKQKLIKTHYQHLSERFKSAAFDPSDFRKVVVAENRILNPTNDVINQFVIDEEILEEKGEDGEPVFSMDGQITNRYGAINGGLFLRYKAGLAASEFKKAVPAFILDQLTGKQYSIDQKLSFVYTLDSSSDKIDSLAQEYADSKFAFIEENKGNLNKMNEIGLSAYKKISFDDKKAYNALLVNINNEIINVEYTKLPQTISKKQYEGLSNIDQYKYSHERDGKFVKRGVFRKNPLDLVAQYHI